MTIQSPLDIPPEGTVMLAASVGAESVSFPETQPAVTGGDQSEDLILLVGCHGTVLRIHLHR
jgi:hypothetical protein